MKDSSENKRDLKEGKGAEVKDGVLNLGDEESYVTTPIEQLGNGNAISFDLELNKPSKPGDILFEADPAYGTHDIRVMENGKLGFTRELYDYYFDYELPVGKKVNLKIVSTQQKTELFADGRSVGTAVGKFVHNGQVKKEGIKNATFALPIERIGSKTNALAGKIDNVVVSAVNTEDKYNKKIGLLLQTQNIPTILRQKVKLQRRLTEKRIQSGTQSGRREQERQTEDFMTERRQVRVR